MALYSPKRARRGLIDTIGFRALSQVATMAGFVIFVRAMPEEDFGVFNLLYAFIPVVSTVASLGLEQTLRRYQPEYLRNDNVSAARSLVRFVASTRFAVNVILLGAILLAWTHLAPIFKLTPFRPEFAFFCLLILLHFQARILQIALAGNMLHRYSVGSVAVLSILKLSAYVALSAANKLSLQTAIVADTISNGVAYLFLAWAYSRHCPPATNTAPFKPDADEKRRLFRYGAFNNFNDAGTFVLSSKSDNFFIAAFIDPLSVGIYAFYTRLSQMFAQLQPARLFENVIQPLFFSVERSEAEKRLPRYFTLLINTTLMLQWPLLSFTAAYHHEIVWVVFGGKFSEQSYLLPFIVAFATAEAFGRPITLVAQYEEKVEVILASKLFGIYNVFAIIVLLPLWGLIGAVLATGTAAVMKNGYIWWHVRRSARWLGYKSALGSIAAVWLTATLICLTINASLNVSSLAKLLLGGITCAIAFLVHVRTPAIGLSDRHILEEVLSGKERRLFVRLGLLSENKRRPA